MLPLHPPHTHTTLQVAPSLDGDDLVHLAAWGAGAGGAQHAPLVRVVVERVGVVGMGVHVTSTTQPGPPPLGHGCSPNTWAPPPPDYPHCVFHTHAHHHHTHTHTPQALQLLDAGAPSPALPPATLLDLARCVAAVAHLDADPPFFAPASSRLLRGVNAALTAVALEDLAPTCGATDPSGLHK